MSDEREPSLADCIDRFVPDSEFPEHGAQDGGFYAEMEEPVPCHQPEVDDSPLSLSSAPSDDEQPWVPTEAEKDAKERSVKRPRAVSPGFDALPDLVEIFDNYDVPPAQRVSICRAYASYVASTLPKKPRKKRSSKALKK